MKQCRCEDCIHAKMDNGVFLGCDKNYIGVEKEVDYIAIECGLFSEREPFRERMNDYEIEE